MIIFFSQFRASSIIFVKSLCFGTQFNFSFIRLLFAINDAESPSLLSANSYFRKSANILEEKYKLKIKFPDIEYCTDNAAMIAMAGYLNLKNNQFSELDIEANPNIIYNSNIV